jgi:hypothetical protein
MMCPSEVQEVIKGLKVGKAPGPNGVPNRALRHLPKRAITFIMKLFNAVLCRQYFPPSWKHACVISILKPGKDPTLPSSYRPISLLDTVGKLFEMILLTRIFREVNERRLLCDRQFRPRDSMALQLDHLVERVSRNFDGRRLTGAIFLDVAKAFEDHYAQFPVLPGENLIFITARSKRPSNQPQPHVISCGLEWPRADSSPLCCSVCI